MSKLIIVESPPKAKTIKKFLGSDYEVVASMGHVRDLPENRLSVDLKNNFAPKYAIIKGKEDLVESLKAAASKSECVYLATDPDREGEAISWHIAYILGLDLNDANRVTFNEITETGLKKGMANPRSIDLDLVDAQQCRRILDRIVGYRLSPFVSQKIRRGLSAGRVQSVALRMICDREDEIRAFVPEEYWSIDAKLVPQGAKRAFGAEFFGTADGKVELKDKDSTDAILAELENESFTVTGLKKGVRKKSPAPPFITSTLQQEASRKLSFRSSKTMKIAQELYEGVEIEGMGAVGLITYMRTDSIRISDEARAEGEEYIKQRWGANYLPDKPHKFKTRANAQDAHEAIRPTMPSLEPEKIKSSLSTDQYKLYKLIWERFTASLMAHCLHDTANADITAGKYLFKASGYTVKFEGYTALYEATADDSKKEESVGALPKLEIGMNLKVKSLEGGQHFTQPPARYTEDTLTRALEENGVGRPSTYVAIVSTVVGREYVIRDAKSKSLKPTELGEQINKLIKERFSKIINVKFTAQMEKNLDMVESGDKDWIDTLRNYYDDFEKILADAKKAMEGITMKLPEEETDFICEKCGRRMVVKLGRYGKFIACPGYPECKNIKKIVNEIDVNCPKCGSKVIVKKSKRGRTFYGCSSYPNCDFVSWNEPTNEKCPQCGGMLFERKGKYPKLCCEAEGCGYERKKEEETAQ
ncbi:MAG: type I DNA topoisomerase [Clostridia bacterium]|nr:type I DNA topoisomerase [Oscillospiraceae bacterium]MBQ6797032.1 type I DNA topoisomerase [Clostridia bacterium]